MNHTAQTAEKTGILLVNLGTPNSTSWWDIRHYLKEFLSDQRVIELNPLLWWCILNGPILTFRPSKTARAYKKVWNNETDESPLRFFTREQGEKLAQHLATHDNLIVDWAMRYGTPSMHDKIHALQAQGCQNIILLPLYPQYSATTTATVCDEAFRVLMKMRHQPSLHVVPPYPTQPAYIQALANSITTHLSTLSWQPDVILASFHGLPQEYADRGDPYPDQCRATADALRQQLHYSDQQLQLTFQSRFGPKQWLQPYTDKTLEQLAEQGVKNIAVICPGFAADCIETLEEIAMEGKEVFIEHGGENFSMIPCLNAQDDHIALFDTLIKPYINN